MKKITRIAALLLALSFGLSLAACKGGNASGLTRVTLVLDYVPNTNHTGFYAAQKLGYYASEGLDVNIIEPADNSVTTLVATGKADFGVSFQEDVTYALTAEQPLPIKAIATIIQHNTSGFASLKSENIANPKDFEGKTYAGWGSPSEQAVVQAVMKSSGADPSKLNFVTSDSLDYTALLGSADLLWIFWAWDGIAAQHAGLDLNYLELRSIDERLDYYTPVIIASDGLLADKPDLARKFLAATSKGYQYCIDEPAKAADILQEHVDKAYDLSMLVDSQKYLAGKYAEGAARWGEMKSEVWDNYTAFMVENGLIDKAIPASDCYTNEFLPSAPTK
ncbi:MAG: ABC transporter substrate-binding protein [Firmicutes bacterium]|nr:ABC transporter substrate-binding protein [Bacillota bacterium]